MKSKTVKKKNEMDRAQDAMKRKGIAINVMVFSILSFIAVLLISKMA